MRRSGNNRFTRLLFALFFLVRVPCIFGFGSGGLEFFVNNELLLNLNRTDEESGQYYETLSVFGNAKKISFNLVLRANNYFKRDPNTTLENGNFDIYRKSVQFSSNKLKVTLGDFYSVLGHGLVLSVQKNEEIFRERTITGADLKFHQGNLDLRLMAGGIRDDAFIQEWRVIAGETSIRISKHHQAGARFSYINDFDTLRSLGNRITSSLSIRGNHIFRDLSYYAELAFLSFPENERIHGTAVYSNMTFNRSHTTLLLEYRKYENFDNELNNPPVADREDEFTSLTDSEGIRLLAQYTLFDPEISFYVNIGHYREYEDKGFHFYSGISALDIRDRISLNMSYGIRDILYPVKKAHADLSWQISDFMNLNVQATDKRYRDHLFIFNEQDHVIQLSHSNGVAVFFSHQFSHNRIIGLNHFFSGGLTLSLAEDLEIRLMGGALRGGQVCSGGQCYVLPPFRGIKFSLLKTFR